MNHFKDNIKDVTFTIKLKLIKLRAYVDANAQKLVWVVNKFAEFVFSKIKKQ